MSKDVLLDFDELEKAAGEQLQFQAYTMPGVAPGFPSSSIFQPDPSIVNTRENVVMSTEAAQLGSETGTEPQPGMWSMAFYQRLFDVDTDQVVKRIFSSVVPTRGGSFYDSDIKRKPDLYGPFWICVTLVFSTAIAGNLYNYFMTAVSGSPWRYDFHKVPYAATAIFSYSWLLPLILYGLLWWRKVQGDLSFLELLCVYGYSLAIYIPVSLLWLIPVPWFQWTLVIVAAALSGSVLLLTLWPAVSSAEKRIAVMVMFAILVFHLALAAGFLLYFFHVPNLPQSHAVTLSPSPLVNASINSNDGAISKRSENSQSLQETTIRLKEASGLNPAFEKNASNGDPKSVKSEILNNAASELVGEPAILPQPEVKPVVGIAVKPLAVKNGTGVVLPAAINAQIPVTQ